MCPTPWGSMGCSPPASSVHGISKTRILEWVAISSSRRLTQGSNLGLLHWQVGSLPQSHLGSPIKTLPKTRWKECRPCIHLNPYQQPCPWTTAVMLMILGYNRQFLKGTSSLCPRFSGKAMKLFFSTWHKTVSKIWFGTSRQRPRF